MRFLSIISTARQTRLRSQTRPPLQTLDTTGLPRNDDHSLSITSTISRQSPLRRRIIVCHGLERSRCPSTRRSSSAVQGVCSGREGELLWTYRRHNQCQLTVTGGGCFTEGIGGGAIRGGCQCQAGSFFTDKSQESGELSDPSFWSRRCGIMVS